MNKYQLVTMDVTQCHAGSKAPSDVSKILDEMDYERVVLHYRTSEKFFAKATGYLRTAVNIFKVTKSIEADSILVVQYPFPLKDILVRVLINKLRGMKRTKVILFLHDVDELRYTVGGVKRKRFTSVLDMSTCIIAHNEKMLAYLEERGVDKNKLINLRIFDYLNNAKIKEKNFSRQVTIAGSLDSSKAGYLKYLRDIKDVQFVLFGPFYDSEIGGENLRYAGIVPPDELPQHLNSGFGLIWDGSSIDTCDGMIGKYLRYNNPHKMSLYIAAGIPVIVWKDAAQAKFVEENGIGFAITSLTELAEKLEMVTAADYSKFIESVKNLSEKMRSGYFTKEAINECEKKLHK